MRNERTPVGYLPTEHELLGMVRGARSGLSLRELALQVWPGLTWEECRDPWWIFPAAGYPSTRRGQACWQPDPEWPEATVRRSPSEWLRDRLQDLIVVGLLRHTPQRMFEDDREAAISYAATGGPPTMRGALVRHRLDAPALLLVLLLAGVAYAGKEAGNQGGGTRTERASWPDIGKTPESHLLDEIDGVLQRGAWGAGALGALALLLVWRLR